MKYAVRVLLVCSLIANSLFSVNNHQFNRPFVTALTTTGIASKSVSDFIASLFTQSLIPFAPDNIVDKKYDSMISALVWLTANKMTETDLKILTENILKASHNGNIKRALNAVDVGLKFTAVLDVATIIAQAAMDSVKGVQNNVNIHPLVESYHSTKPYCGFKDPDCMWNTKKHNPFDLDITKMVTPWLAIGMSIFAVASGTGKKIGSVLAAKMYGNNQQYGHIMTEKAVHRFFETLFIQEALVKLRDWFDNDQIIENLIKTGIKLEIMRAVSWPIYKQFVQYNI